MKILYFYTTQEILGSTFQKNGPTLLFNFIGLYVKIILAQCARGSALEYYDEKRHIS